MTSKPKPYPEYRRSPLLWLGDIPTHWQLYPARACYAPKNEPNTGLKESRVLSLSYGRIIVKASEKLRGLVPESFETYQIVDPGDIVIRTTDLQNDHNSLRVGLVRNRGIITSAYLALQTLPRLTPEYGYLHLNAWDLTKAIYAYGSGLRQNLDFAHFKHMPVPVPPKSEQEAIVGFLKETDMTVDRFIRNRRRLIKTLDEQKQAIVRRLVTRGLDPDVPLKPSGVEWLGDVPAHWEILRAKYLFKEVDERSSSGTEELLSVSHITGVTPRSQKNITMFMAESYVGHKICRPGDLVVNTMWAWMKAMGISSQLGIVSPSYAIYRPTKAGKVVGGYFDHLLRTPKYGAEYWRRSTGIRKSRLRLYPDDFLRIPILVPPRHEQEEIAKYIASATHQLNSAILNAEREIALIREYRTRLVSDVVTGKLDVRGISSAEKEFLDEDIAADKLNADATETEDSELIEEAIDGDD